MLEKINDMMCPICKCSMKRMMGTFVKVGAKRFDCGSCKIKIIVGELNHRKKITHWRA